jgi:hypothetical protein
MLPYSGCVYIEAANFLSQDEWIEFIDKAIRYFGGSADILTMDKVVKYCDADGRQPFVINSKLLSFANHHGLVVSMNGNLPSKEAIMAREDGNTFFKLLIEGVKNKGFKSIAEVNSHILSEARKFNDNNFTVRGVSRRNLFSQERSVLRPLPSNDYEPQEWFERKASSLGVVTVDENLYPVPDSCANKVVFVKVTSTLVDFYHGGSLVATYSRQRERDGLKEIPAA